MSTNKLFAWQETKTGLAFIALFDFLVAYIFVSLALNSGSLLDYFIAFIFLVLGVVHAVKFVRKLSHKS